MAKRRKLKPTILLKRWIDVQKVLGWSNEQMAAEIGVTVNCWNSWRRGDYRPGNKFQIILKSKIERLEDLATKPETDRPTPPKAEEPKKKTARRYSAEMTIEMLQRITGSIAISNDSKDDGAIKLLIEGGKVVGAEYVVKIAA